ncbi:hypothetical protein ADK94_30045 [Streptomyces sp. XY593]|nr:hypothetical protein ADK49_25525 [Streptomyces sp. WM6349]KOU80095.1 hypothetical protein ADK94_30045 [Streptomyces sp. XY593]KOV03000.1 hypothetical protein ADK92_08720 [Streptomyces sp. XY533]KOV15573.1 hypothetical protein ADK91_05265 [Streptomyces sp. XY511]KOV46217.1 hypothetical protein ADK98_13695 [Streptomyces sp. H036]
MSLLQRSFRPDQELDRPVVAIRADRGDRHVTDYELHCPALLGCRRSGITRPGSGPQPLPRARCPHECAYSARVLSHLRSSSVPQGDEDNTHPRAQLGLTHSIGRTPTAPRIPREERAPTRPSRQTA